LEYKMNIFHLISIIGKGKDWVKHQFSKEIKFSFPKVLFYYLLFRCMSIPCQRILGIFNLVMQSGRLDKMWDQWMEVLWTALLYLNLLCLYLKMPKIYIFNSNQGDAGEKWKIRDYSPKTPKIPQSPNWRHNIYFRPKIQIKHWLMTRIWMKPI
jgi:hypothetical protein